jgi:hypothetical protein
VQGEKALSRIEHHEGGGVEEARGGPVVAHPPASDDVPVEADEAPAGEGEGR